MDANSPLSSGGLGDESIDRQYHLFDRAPSKFITEYINRNFLVAVVERLHSLGDAFDG